MVTLRFPKNLHPGFFLVVFIPLLAGGCIERYFPEEEEVKVGILVVSADLTDMEGLQTITLSRSTPLDFPSFDAEANCFVQVEREDASSVLFAERVPGIYEGFVEEHWLVTGSACRLQIITPEGERYESSFETLHPAVGIDSLYFNNEFHPTTDPAVTEEGVRFCLDFEINRDAARYLRWKLIETWEMHNPEFSSRRMVDTDRRMKPVPDSVDNPICWITMEVPEIFTRDLGGVSGSRYRAMPLNFVSTETQRLHHRYSLLVQQYSLGAEAFRYWDELGKNIQGKGTLFDTQPSLTPSNICNVDDEEEPVIGYFSVAGVTERRIIVQEIPGLTIRDDPDFCVLGPFPYNIGQFADELLPCYIAGIMIDGDEVLGSVPRRCIDCREYRGSTTVPPEYWTDIE
ncbi:MAG: DUF4249 domain-containing protein [Bacteroidales bacterium]